MKFEPGKILQNIELKLRGRTAMVAVGVGVMAVLFWLLMRDYNAHPLFSAIWGTGLLVGILGFLALALLGKTRPEEVSDKSFMHVDQLGIYVAQGYGALNEGSQWPEKIPAPSHFVKGLASNPNDYVSLTSDQANAVIAKVESGIEKFLDGFVNQATAESTQHKIADSSAENPEESQGNKGKTLTS
jgi:hypothetical protein